MRANLEPGTSPSSTCPESVCERVPGSLRVSCKLDCMARGRADENFPSYTTGVALDSSFPTPCAADPTRAASVNSPPGTSLLAVL